MLRSGALALVLVGCGSAMEASPGAAVAPELRACEPFVLDGISNGGGAECVPPQTLGAFQSGERWWQNGRWLEAADCFVAAYEASVPRDSRLAELAGRAYDLAGRRDLARVYPAR